MSPGGIPKVDSVRSGNSGEFFRQHRRPRVVDSSNGKKKRVTIKDLMTVKRSSQARDAALALVGFLGIGTDR